MGQAARPSTGWLRVRGLQFPVRVRVHVYVCMCVCACVWGYVCVCVHTWHVLSLFPLLLLQPLVAPPNGPPHHTTTQPKTSAEPQKARLYLSASCMLRRLKMPSSKALLLAHTPLTPLTPPPLPPLRRREDGGQASQACAAQVG